MDSETLNSPPKSSSSTLNSSKLLVLYIPPAQSSPPPPPQSDHPNRLQSMICAAPTTAKSSKWLRRLRCSRGFPDTDHIDLEQFLSSSLEEIDAQTCTESTLTDKTPQLDENIVADERDDSGAQGRDVINNVLSELFHMGEFQDKSRIKRKKSYRKQHCPRICVVSTNSDVQNDPIRKDRVSSPLPLPLTFNSRRKVKEVNQEFPVTEIAEDEDEKSYCDLSMYSQTEVTVIDTSVPSWKFEKMLYRRKNIWKIRDKNGKGLMSSDRNKRKEIVDENGDVQKKKLKLCSSLSKSPDAEKVCEKKKMKKLKKKKKKRLQLCNSSKYVDKEETIGRSKYTQGNDQGKATVPTYEKKHDKSNQVQEKSLLKKQIDGGSSVILVKSIPITNKKDVSGISKGYVKSMQK